MGDASPSQRNFLFVCKSGQNENASFDIVTAYNLLEQRQSHSVSNAGQMTPDPARTIEDLISKIRESFRRLHDAGTGLHGLFFVVSSGPDSQMTILNSTDQAAIVQIFKCFGCQLLEYVYFLLTDEKWTEMSNFVECQRQLLAFLSQSCCRFSAEQWKTMQYHAVCLSYLDSDYVMDKLPQIPYDFTPCGPYTQPFEALAEDIDDQLLQGHLKKAVSSLISLRYFEFFFYAFAPIASVQAANLLEKLYGKIFSNPNYLPIGQISAWFSLFTNMLISLVQQNSLEAVAKFKEIQRRFDEQQLNIELDENCSISTFGSACFTDSHYKRPLQFMGAYSMQSTGNPTWNIIDCFDGVFLCFSNRENVGNCIIVEESAKVQPKQWERLEHEKFRNFSLRELAKSEKPCFLFVNEENLEIFKEILPIVQELQIPVRSLMIRSEIRPTDPNRKWTDPIDVCRSLFANPNLKEFYYFTNHTDFYEEFSLEILLEKLGLKSQTEPAENLLKDSPTEPAENLFKNRIECFAFNCPFPVKTYPPNFFKNFTGWPEMPNLRELHLRFMRLPASAMRHVVAGFKKFPNLKLLNLLFSNMEEIEADETIIPGSNLLAKSLKDIPKLEFLNVQGSRLSPDSLKILCESTKNFCSELKTIVLSENQFKSGKTIEDCLMILKDLPNLNRIDFNWPGPPKEIFPNFKDQTNFITQIVSPFHEPNSFPAIRQLRFGLYELPRFVEQAIDNGVRSFREQCSIEF